MALVLVAVLLGLWMAREPLGEQISHGTERARLLDQAQRALNAGELSREDGRGARELYLAVLALDPDHQAARQGVADTGRAALAEAERASAQGETARAEAMLQLARELNVPEHELARVQAVRAQRDGDDEADLGNLLARIQNTRRGRTASEAMPLLLPLYAQALELAPDHLLVLTSRSRLLGEVLDEAGRDIAAGDLDAAHDKIELVAEVDSAHAALPGVRGRLSEARQQQAARRPPPPSPAIPLPPPVRPRRLRRLLCRRIPSRHRRRHPAFPRHSASRCWPASMRHWRARPCSTRPVTVPGTACGCCAPEPRRTRASSTPSGASATAPVVVSNSTW
ncbi:hypothetical protein [Alkalisalibacterium limincola]|uniref:Tetratricopeptide repeat protein n=1 Tax=Alkalisalibacterium limincola TaxID=2699169 RepID=A0A5C8KRQ2_9GAMM|nr:hypothetical protein [Alkalisalibacterium limincola]TXK62635.1 hypothetical protein FU658_07800 [Alkalisalibacterium limincola]